jgi:hypothetical protein
LARSKTRKVPLDPNKLFRDLTDVDVALHKERDLVAAVKKKGKDRANPRTSVSNATTAVAQARSNAVTTAAGASMDWQAFTSCWDSNVVQDDIDSSDSDEE